MYVPDKWKITEKKDIYAFIEQHAFATLLSPSLQASHVPLILDRENNQLLGHVAKSNPHWCELSEQKCLAIFHGAHSYISPTWYREGPNVPTWNYAAVHVKGTMTLLAPTDTLNMLNTLMDKYEPSLIKERTVVTHDYQEKLSKGIVGFAMKIESIEAKAKLGQHRSEVDQQGVTAALQQSTFANDQALLALMQQLRLGLGAE